MLHAGLDLSPRRLDYCLLDARGDRVEVGAAPPAGDGLRGFARGIEDRHGTVVRAAIEVDERCAVCARHAGALWLGGRGRRRAEGQVRQSFATA